MTKNWDRNFTFTMLGGAVACLAIATLVSNPFLLSLAGYTCVLAMMGLSINLMLGGIGEVPLGQALFYGIGAYAIGIATKTYGLPYEAALLIGIAVAAGLAALLGAFTLKLTGAYFSIVSWGFASVAVVITLNLEHFTGGGMGIFGMPSMKIVGFDLSNPTIYFIACSFLLGIVLALLNALHKSRFGLAIESVRQNAHLARSIGVNVFRERLKTFVISAAIAALAGGLTPPYTQIVTHEMLSVFLTVDALLIVLLGGTRWLFGPVVGAAVFSVLPFYIEMDITVRVLVFSTLIIVIMLFLPGGLHELGKRVFGLTERGADARR